LSAEPKISMTVHKKIIADYYAKKGRQNFCWCGRPASDRIKQKLPGAEIVTYVCPVHREPTYNAIKWYLVVKSLWIPKCLVVEKV